MIWIVGKSLSGFRKELEQKSIAYGIFWDAKLPQPEGLTAPIIPLDFSHPDTLADQVSQHKDLPVSGIVVASYENYVLPAAYLAKVFNVPGPSIEAATAATDKAVMRQRFIDFDPSLSPAFAEVSTWDDIAAFAHSHEFPLMLKPASLMKSLLITKNSDITELQKNFKQTSDEINRLYDKYSISQKPKLIIEEFLQGTMHTVAAFADSEGKPILLPGIVDCVTAQEKGYYDNFLYSRTLPTILAETDQQALYTCADKGIRALGLTSCPAHVEMMLTPSGPKIIEIGARVGGYRHVMYQYAYDIDVNQLLIDTALETNLSVEPNNRGHIAVFELFPENEGKFVALKNETAVRELKSFRFIGIMAEPEQTIGKSSSGYKATATIILNNTDREQFMRDVDFINRNVSVQIED